MRITSKSLTLLLLAIFGATGCFTRVTHAGGAVSVAIMDLESSNLSVSRTGMVNRKIMREASRKTGTISNGRLVNALLHERLSKSAMTGSADLTARIGRAIGAHKVLTGLVSRVNDIFIVTLKLTDVDNRSVRQVTKNCRGKFDRFLSVSVRDAVAEILR